MEEYIPRLSDYVPGILVIRIVGGPNRNNNLHILDPTLTSQRLHIADLVQFDSLHQPGAHLRRVYTLHHIFEGSDRCGSY